MERFALNGLCAVVLTAVLMSLATDVCGQVVDPDLYRGTEEAVTLGTSAANLVEVRMSNHGEFIAPFAFARAIWPRGIGGGHVDGIGLLVGSRVKGERSKWAPWMPQWEGKPDTTLTPISIYYGEVGDRRGSTDDPWGWLPVPGFHNADRINSIGQREPLIASSDDPSTWPDVWPDRLDEFDSGWPGRWNGLLGADSLIDGREMYYVMDDLSSHRYLVDPETHVPNSVDGVFYPDPADSTKGGLGLQIGVRSLAFRPVLFEDVVFYHIRLANVGGVSHDSVYVALYADMGLGQEEGDEIVVFDSNERLLWAYDQDGLGQRPDGTVYELGYLGVTFLGDSPGLTGYDVAARPFYETDDHFQDDGWLWDRIREAESRIVDGVGESREYADFEPAILITSGPYSLAPNQVVSMVAALIFGAGPDERDLYRNLVFARSLYDSEFKAAIVVDVEHDVDLPTGFVLGPSYPNPFYDWTTISYDLSHPADATLTVYDLLGRTVKELATGRQPAGTYEVTFDATGLPSGIYLYRLQAGDYVETKRMVVVR